MIGVVLSEDQVDEMMKLADLNKDGQINFDGK
jgi:Ca2+-binding EF-hand superfamily protein